VVFAVLVAAFFVYLVAGHAVHPGQTMDEATLGSGICIILVTLAAGVGIARQPGPVARFRPFAFATPVAAPIASAPAAPARASPAWLGRFLN
jgi:hypothetical protein